VIPDSTEAWKRLTRLASENVRTKQPDPTEFSSRSFEAAGILLDFSKQRLDPDILQALLDLADQVNLGDQLAELFAGAHLNTTEDRPVLHTALRAAESKRPAIAGPAAPTMRRVMALAEAVRQGTWRGHSGKAITDVVNIGIGGSHLGPELAVEALARAHHLGPRIHFVANVDAANISTVLRRLDPERTLFIIASKSFSTLETRLNADTARRWFLERVNHIDAIAKHFVAISTNLEAAAEFGIPEANVFEMWDWVGGRFSIWSPVGLALALAIGAEQFQQFLDGARSMDEHFQDTPFDSNLPVLLALVAIWNYNFLGTTNQAILPYAERLRLLPDYLQQLLMESNGKSVHNDGSDVRIHTMPVVWGGRGSNGQHAFHQLLHQGTRSFAADFVLIADTGDRSEHQRWLLANGLAQSQAMLSGHVDVDPHKRVAGNKSTTTIVLEQLSPKVLGALLALYEHMVFCQGVIWNINSFDQWGVELGKHLAIPIYEQLGGKTAIRQDPSTRGLIEHLTRKRQQNRSMEDD
jgi:glucose-6-phosphate isomerase